MRNNNKNKVITRTTSITRKCLFIWKRTMTVSNIKITTDSIKIFLNIFYFNMIRFSSYSSWTCENELDLFSIIHNIKEEKSPHFFFLQRLILRNFKWCLNGEWHTYSMKTYWVRSLNHWVLLLPLPVPMLLEMSMPLPLPLPLPPSVLTIYTWIFESWHWHCNLWAEFESCLPSEKKSGTSESQWAYIELAH